MTMPASPASRDSSGDATFRSVVAGLESGAAAQRQARPELVFDDEPPPRKLAPYAAALAAAVYESSAARRADAVMDTAREIGWGKFVVLYDPAGQPGWAGPFRVIAYIRADLEPDIAADPLIGQVGWTWLTESLDVRAASYQAISGTVTRVVTEGFGAKDDEPVATGFELRASWSPTGAEAVRPDLISPGAARPDLTGHIDITGHVAAWCDALAAASGLPPVPGVRQLPPQLRRKP